MEHRKGCLQQDLLRLRQRVPPRCICCAPTPVLKSDKKQEPEQGRALAAAAAAAKVAAAAAKVAAATDSSEQSGSSVDDAGMCVQPSIFLAPLPRAHQQRCHVFGARRRCTATRGGCERIVASSAERGGAARA